VFDFQRSPRTHNRTASLPSAPSERLRCPFISNIKRKSLVSVVVRAAHSNVESLSEHGAKILLNQYPDAIKLAKRANQAASAISSWRSG
jgi:hypothetical protein